MLTTTQRKNNIIDGNINPGNYFSYIGDKMDIRKCFIHSIDSLGILGCWKINNSETYTMRDVEFSKYLLYSPYDEIYYLQRSQEEGESHIICAKVGRYYFYFEEIYGWKGGIFSYNTDWTVLWNRYMTADSRNILLIANNYEELVVMATVQYNNRSLTEHARLWDELVNVNY